MQKRFFLDNSFFNCLSAVALSYPGWLALRMMAGFESFPAEQLWGYVPLALFILSLMWYANKVIRHKERRRSLYEWASLLIIQLTSLFLVMALRFISQAYDIGFDDRLLPLGLVMALGVNSPFVYLLWLSFWRRRTYVRTI